MDTPIAFRLLNENLQAFSVTGLDVPKLVGSKALTTISGPSIVVVSSAAVLPEMKAGVFNISDILVAHEGDGDQSIVIILPDTTFGKIGIRPERKGDQRFLDSVRTSTAELYNLAFETITATREAGVDGDLEEGPSGRWINRPVNTFTLKVQPRVKNIHFTLYGNPETYAQSEFLLPDQNSYSRGWIRNNHDIEVFAKLAKESHSRRAR